MNRQARSLVALLSVLLLLMAVTPVEAGGANVLPPTAKPKGYSLTEAARITGNFNVGNAYGIAVEKPTDFPFEILYTGPESFTVRRGTRLYIPVAFAENSEPVLGDYPDQDATRAEVVHYWTDPSQLGGECFTITIDGKETALGPAYLAGPVPLTIPDFGGTRYIVIAAFVNPLPKGTHEVIIAGLFTGDALKAYPEFFPDGKLEFTIAYTVIVK